MGVTEEITLPLKLNHVSVMIIIALGSNLRFGNKEPENIILKAIEAIDRLYPCPVRSSLYQSPAWPDPNDPPFINAVIASHETGDPYEILESLHGVEAAFGRQRSVRNAPRTLDLDLLAVDQLVISPDITNSEKQKVTGKQRADGRDLSLPHPALQDRDFVLVPLAECLPDWRHPVTGFTALKMCERLNKANIKTFTS